MRLKKTRLLRFTGVLCMCGMFIAVSTVPAFAKDEKKCKKVINQTIKLMKKGEILKFNGKKMLKALESYEDGISKSEAKKLDLVMGPFDDNFKVMKKIYNNIQDIKEYCQ